MRLSVKIQNSLKEFENLILPVPEGGEPALKGRGVPGAAQLRLPIEQGDFSGKAGQTLLLYGPSGSRRLLVGLGKSPHAASAWRDAAAAAQKAFAGAGVKQAAFALPADADLFEAATGLLLSGYRYERYLPRKRKGKRLGRVTLVLPEGSPRDEAEAARRRAERQAAGTLLARDLMNAPANLAGPEFLAETAREIAEKSEGRIRVRVKKGAQLEKENFSALLAVGRGSHREARLIELEYNPGGERTIVLVGKGITFDSGGLSLKPAASMEEMKFDMGGAAAVLGVFRALAEMEIPLRVVGVVPSCENMPGGNAYRPGDIIRARSGATIEVKNTDAEGRLILADGLDYAKEFAPDLIVDLATLTGACVVALGHECAGLFANEKGGAWIDALRESGERSGERVWPLPMFEEYEELIESPVAEIKNTGGRDGGAITAAKFLQRFADPRPWMHIDIAGTAWRDKERGIRPKGGNGFGVRLLLDFLERF